MIQAYRQDLRATGRPYLKADAAPVWVAILFFILATVFAFDLAKLLLHALGATAGHVMKALLG